MKMLQPHWTKMLQHLALAGILSVCIMPSGCAAVTDGSPQDPFRTPASPVRMVREAPAPFAWQTAERTDAGEPLQTWTTGSNGFRTLVIGSVGGNDPVAVRLTEDLAVYLHRNQLIMGGMKTTVLRTLNPDGLKLNQHENAAGQYLNDCFPAGHQSLRLSEQKRLPREVRFVMHQVVTQRPQRIVHIRTIRDADGMLAVSRGAEDSGREVAQWLNFNMKKLPEGASSGTMEAWAAQREDCDVITIGIPRDTELANAWPLYGDAILNLLLDGDSESRRVARERRQQRAASREDAWADPLNRTDSEMFREDPVPQPFDSAAAPKESELE